MVTLGLVLVALKFAVVFGVIGLAAQRLEAKKTGETPDES
jgi:hypothetical protein